MGGAKKKSPAQQEKSQKDEGEKKSGTKKKGKKGDKKEGEGKKAEISVILEGPQAMKIITSSKMLTVHELARQTGVKVSAANAFLKKLVQEGSIKRAGGYSGHFVYQPVAK